jgi:HSP20 family protein
MAVFRLGQRWDPLRDLEREVDRLLQSVNLTFHGVRAGRKYPAVNLHESSDAYILTAELPATAPEDLEVTLANGLLTLSGHRRDEEHIAEERFRRQERPQGTWQRSLPVPDRIEEDQLSADFHNGVLVIRLPKAPQEEPRQIPISSN